MSPANSYAGERHAPERTDCGGRPAAERDFPTVRCSCSLIVQACGEVALKGRKMSFVRIEIDVGTAQVARLSK